jgi:glycerophosphoryl diester phosphodiesterase
LADGEIAVFHDSELHRMTGQTGELAQQTAQTLQHFRLLETSERIPLFREALEFIDGRVPLLIEIKNFEAVGPLETTILRDLAHYQGEYAIQSFNPFVITWFKKHAPQVVRGQLATGIPHGAIDRLHYFIQKNLLLNWLSAPHFLAYDVQSLPHFPVWIARRCLNIPLLAWTIKNQEEQIKAFKYADNIIFDQFLAPERGGVSLTQQTCLTTG